MKKVLLACLLGFGTLLPTIEANSSIAVKHRILSITLEGYALRASSDAASGLISQIQIYNVSTGLLVRTQSCDGYSCSVSTSGLPNGVYVGIVITTNTIGKKQFSIG